MRGSACAGVFDVVVPEVGEVVLPNVVAAVDEGSVPFFQHPVRNHGFTQPQPSPACPESSYRPRRRHIVSF